MRNRSAISGNSENRTPCSSALLANVRWLIPKNAAPSCLRNQHSIKTAWYLVAQVSFGAENALVRHRGRDSPQQRARLVELRLYLGSPWRMACGAATIPLAKAPFSSGRGMMAPASDEFGWRTIPNASGDSLMACRRWSNGRLARNQPLGSYRHEVSTWNLYSSMIPSRISP